MTDPTPTPTAAPAVVESNVSTRTPEPGPSPTDSSNGLLKDADAIVEAAKVTPSPAVSPTSSQVVPASLSVNAPEAQRPTAEAAAEVAAVSDTNKPTGAESKVDSRVNAGLSKDEAPAVGPGGVAAGPKAAEDAPKPVDAAGGSETTATPGVDEPVKADTVNDPTAAKPPAEPAAPAAAAADPKGTK